MRHTVFLRTSAAVSVAAIVITQPSGAQDRATRERDAAIRQRDQVVASRDGTNRVRIWTNDDDRDRAVLGVMLGTARDRRDTLGVRVTDVTPGGPAEKAGIEEGDRIVSIDGTPLRVDAADIDDPSFADLASRRLQRALAKRKAGDEVALIVQRGRDTRTVRVMTTRSDELSNTMTRGFNIVSPSGGAIMLRGGESMHALRDSTNARADRRAALGVSLGASGSVRDTLGLFVSSVVADGPAEKAGLIEGARVASINGVDVRVSREDAEDVEIAQARARRFTRELDKRQPGDDIALRVWQNGAYRNVTVKAGKSSDVWKGQNSFHFSFGDGGDGLMVPPMPPMPAMAPLPANGGMLQRMAMPSMPKGPSVHYAPAEGIRVRGVPRAPVAPMTAVPAGAPRARRVVYL